MKLLLSILAVISASAVPHVNFLAAFDGPEPPVSAKCLAAQKALFSAAGKALAAVQADAQKIGTTQGATQCKATMAPCQVDGASECCSMTFDWSEAPKYATDVAALKKAAATVGADTCWLNQTLTIKGKGFDLNEKIGDSFPYIIAPACTDADRAIWLNFMGEQCLNSALPNGEKITHCGFAFASPCNSAAECLAAMAKTGCTKGGGAACETCLRAHKATLQQLCEGTGSAQTYCAAAAKTADDHDAERQRFVDTLNAQPGMLWKAGLNPRFQGKPIGYSKRSNGVDLEKNRAVMEAAIAGGKAVRVPPADPAVAKKLPASFDSETNWPQCKEVIGDIRDQSDCGCCWAFGGAEAASDRMCINTGAKLKLPLSAQDACFCAESGGCDGGALFTVWDYIQSSGLVTGGQYQGTGPFGAGLCSDFSLPHCHHHGPVGHGGDPYPSEGSKGCPSVTNSPQCPSACDAGAKAPHDKYHDDKYTFDGKIEMYVEETAIQNSIMTNGPVETAFTVYADFENYVSGVYHHTSGVVLGGHAVRIVGWGVDGGTKYWKVANSWNPYWGESGYFRIRRGTDECGIESGVTVGNGDWFKRSTRPAAKNATAPSTNKWHYGDTDTGCRMGPYGNPSEEPIKIADLKDKKTFSVCSTPCANVTYPCNDDVPPGTTVKPACVIDMIGVEMCGLPCDPAKEKTQCAYALGARCIMLKDSTQVPHNYCMWPDDSDH